MFPGSKVLADVYTHTCIIIASQICVFHHCCLSPADTHLAEAVRQYVEAGLSVADCFSRNRSFSQKVKRYGKFVPRGQQGKQ